MKAVFCLISGDIILRKHFVTTSLGMVPSEIRGKFGDDFKFLTNPPHLSMQEFVRKTHEDNPDYPLVLLTDVKCKDSVSELGLPWTVLEDPTRPLGTELARVLTFWIKRLSSIAQLFRPLGNQKALLLPLDNFEDDQIAGVWPEILKNFNEREFALHSEIERLLGLIKARERPKKRGSSEKYFIDQRDYHFRYGHERHAKTETDGGDHNFQCAMNSRLRLGLPYDHERHFNVSLANNGNMKGHKFRDCHGSEYTAQSCDHLNMFPNGFVA